MGLFDDLIPQQQQSQPAVMQGAQQPLPAQRTPNLNAQTQPPQMPNQNVGAVPFTGTGPQAAPQPQQGLFDDLIPKQQAPVSPIADAAKGFGVGAAEGAIGLAGMPGDLTSLATGGKYGSGWGSQAIQKGIEGYTGDFYKPQTGLGKFAETAGSFLPAAAAPLGEMSLGARLLRTVVAPAVASEAAGQLTQGTAAEPYARTAAAVIGGGLGAGLKSRPAMPALMDAEQLGKLADYTAPELQGTAFKRSSLQSAKADMQTALGTLADPQMGTQTAKLVNGMAGPGLNSLKFGTVQNTRTLLGQLQGKFADPLEQAAAGKAKDALDNFLNNVQQGDLLTGDADKFKTALSNAQGNLFAAKTLDVLTGKEYAADLSAAAANSGANYENALRQRVKGILLSPAQRSRFEAMDAKYGTGLIDAMNNMVRGGSSDNVVRILGNMMGGGGGMLASHFGLAGWLGGAGPAGLIPPAIGYGLKKLSANMVGNKMESLKNAVAATAPANAPIAAQRAQIAAMPNPGLDYKRALINAALARQQALPPPQ